MRIDHVIYGVRDLDDAADRLESRYGLKFLPAGRHPGRTVNRVALLEPPQYPELRGQPLPSRSRRWPTPST